MEKKMTKKTKKILIGILITLLSLVLILIGAFFALRYYITNTLLDGVSTNEILTAVEKVLEDEELQKYLNSQDPEQTEKLMEQIKEAKGEEVSPSSEDSVPVSTDDNTSDKLQITPTPQPTKAPASDTDRYAKNVPDKYKQALKNVNPKDLADAARLVGRADVGYILGYVGGGISSTERRVELYAYLRQSYSPGEIARGVELFVKYAHLL